MSETLIYINAEHEIAQIEERLGELKEKAPLVLSRAMNDTVKWASRELAKDAQERYRVKTLKFSKEFKTFKATKTRLSAAIKATGANLQTTKFQYSPRAPKTSMSGNTPAKLAILKAKSPRIVTGKGDMKAFVARFASGHVAIVQRQPGQTYTSAGWSARQSRWSEFKRVTGKLDNTKIDEFYGPSVPSMLHKVGVTGEYIEAREPQILEHLQQAITTRINTELHFANQGKG